MQLLHTEPVQLRTDIETQLTRSWQAKTFENVCMQMKMYVLIYSFIQCTLETFFTDLSKNKLYCTCAHVCTYKFKACSSEIKNQ